MKKLSFLLLFIGVFLASPTLSIAKTTTIKNDSPPVKTHILGYFEWGGDTELPAGTYQVLADPADLTKVLYLYDAANDISYECIYSTYSSVTGYADITLVTPLHGIVYWGSVFVCTL